MEAAESHPEQDPRYVEMQRELQRRNEESDIRERELRREMDRREQEIDRRERELRREMDRREQEIDRRERELKRKEEEIDRRESELMREMARTKREVRRELMREKVRRMEEMARTKREVRRELMRGIARREEEMVGHFERRSVPAVLGLPQIRSDQSSKDDFSKPWISFKEPRDLATGKMQQCSSDDLCLSQPSVKMEAAGSHPQPPRSLSEERKRELERREEEIDRRETERIRELKRRERELMREMARRKREEERIELMRGIARREEEMVGHCERRSVPAVLGLSQIYSDQSPEDDFSEPWILFKELKLVRRNSKELNPPEMSESEDNPLDGL